MDNYFTSIKLTEAVLSNGSTLVWTYEKTKGASLSNFYQIKQEKHDQLYLISKGKLT